MIIRILNIIMVAAVISGCKRDPQSNMKAHVELIFQKEISYEEFGCLTNIIGKDDVYYVSDWKSNKIHQLDGKDNLCKSFGGEGNGPGEFQKLSDICLDEWGNLYAADQGRNQIFCFDREGNLLKTITTEHPNISLTVGNDGDLFINTLSPEYSLVRYDNRDNRYAIDFFDKSEDIMLQILENISRLYHYQGRNYRLLYNESCVFEITADGNRKIFEEKAIRNFSRIRYDKSGDEIVIKRGSIVFSDIQMDKDYIYLVSGGGEQGDRPLPHYLWIYEQNNWKLTAKLWPEELDSSEEGYAFYINNGSIYFIGINQDIIYKYHIYITKRLKN